MVISYNHYVIFFFTLLNVYKVYILKLIEMLRVGLKMYTIFNNFPRLHTYMYVQCTSVESYHVKSIKNCNIYCVFYTYTLSWYKFVLFYFFTRIAFNTLLPWTFKFLGFVSSFTALVISSCVFLRATFYGCFIIHFSSVIFIITRRSLNLIRSCTPLSGTYSRFCVCTNISKSLL